MSKAEKFIQDCTRNCSNEYCGEGISIGHGATLSKRCFTPWLTPDQALRAVEITRKEIYEWLEKNIYMYNGECEGDRKGIINDLKQAMKDE